MMTTSRASRTRRRLLVGVFVAAALAVTGVAAHSRAAGAWAPTTAMSPASAPPLIADPALAGVDPELARRFLDAQAAAAADGVSLTITSGKRSVEEQQELVDAAITRYGSKHEASRWVLPPETSAHVVGLALDVGPTAGAYWLGEHGLEFGLCRTYANEVWHFEKLPDDRTACAPMHDDSSSGW